MYTMMAATLQIFLAHFVYRFYAALPTNLASSRFIQYVAENNDLDDSPRF